MSRAVGLAWLLAAPALACALPEHAPRPGGIAVLDLGAAAQVPEVRFDERRVLTLREDGRWYAVVGIPLAQAPGPARLQVGNEPARAIEFAVVGHGYREQHLSVAPSYVNPSPEQLERIVAERQRINAALGNWRAQAPPDLTLAPPVPGARSTSFGSRRVFNNEPRAPHRGMDIAGGAGTPVRAPLGGIVTLAGDFYFTGGTVILDHGRGLVTLYAHLSEIAVDKGEPVATGDALGAVGATGRVTGPHLHFATYLNGTAVDPALLLRPPAP